ncbi:ArsR family transcriptional regulator [Sphingopyxis sp. YF1]|uniref:VpaChn25_0724 family phage protein n=1 Tax=Sphingopyxis sp. YF1 TaxID=2482763 RepID=UPI001F6115C6|nr:ArsR family transcriptional regulator [Sphingopyxis sp. YF1]UNU43615.1 ArsR family transcriptional regulator [Sphingopyxis sp. YF1]
MMNYGDFHFQHVRLTVLRLLAEAPGYSTNDSVLTDAVNAMGLVCTRDQMRTNIAWLEEQRLVTLLRPTATLTVATITERGADVAAGRSIVAGVQRPSPSA